VLSVSLPLPSNDICLLQMLKTFQEMKTIVHLLLHRLENEQLQRKIAIIAKLIESQAEKRKIINFKLASNEIFSFVHLVLKVVENFHA
jgi:Trp operon repressor